jgi:hypothetical protein
VSEGYSGVRVIGGLIVIMGALISGGCALLFKCSRDSSSWNRDGWLSCLGAQGIVALSKMCAQEMSKICALGDRVVL